MNPRFRFTVGSDPDHEDLVGDIYYDDHIVCVLTQEMGVNAMQIELFGPADGGTWKFQLADFEACLATLKRRMWDLRRMGSGDDRPRST
jgi:hypothetical protein